MAEPDAIYLSMRYASEYIIEQSEQPIVITFKRVNYSSGFHSNVVASETDVCFIFEHWNEKAHYHHPISRSRNAPVP